MKSLLTVAVFAISAIASSPHARGQEAFPSKPITIIVPFGPGSGSDIAARLVGQKLTDTLRQPVLIEYKQGAIGSIAAEYVARSKPDGYSILLGTNSTHGANPGLIKNLRYDPIKDFIPLNRIVINTSIVVTGRETPYKTMQELLAYGKTHDLTLGTGNASGVVQGETLARQVGWKNITRIPFKGNAPALTEVLAGRVDFMFSDIPAASPLLASGLLRALAVTSKTRSKVMPNLPTMEELGVKDYDLSGWIAFFAPANTPRPVVERLNIELTKVLQMPDVVAKFVDLGGETGPMTLPEIAKWVQGEVTTWTRLVKEAGIQPE